MSTKELETEGQYANQQTSVGQGKQAVPNTELAEARTTEGPATRVHYDIRPTEVNVGPVHKLSDLANLYSGPYSYGPHDNGQSGLHNTSTPTTPVTDITNVETPAGPYNTTLAQSLAVEEIQGQFIPTEEPGVYTYSGPGEPKAMTPEETKAFFAEKDVEYEARKTENPAIETLDYKYIDYKEAYEVGLISTVDAYRVGVIDKEHVLTDINQGHLSVKDALTHNVIHEGEAYEKFNHISPNVWGQIQHGYDFNPTTYTDIDIEAMEASELAVEREEIEFGEDIENFVEEELELLDHWEDVEPEIEEIFDIPDGFNIEDY